MSTLRVDEIKDSTGASTGLTIDGSGRVLTPAKPSFAAYLSSTVSYGSADAYQKITFDSTHYNVGGHYSTSTGRFTAPVTGIYYLSGVVYIYSVPVAEMKFYVNGSSLYRFAVNSNAGSSVNPNGSSGSVVAQLSANDYVELYAMATATGTIYNGSGSEVATFWSGCLIG